MRPARRTVSRAFRYCLTKPAAPVAPSRTAVTTAGGEASTTRGSRSITTVTTTTTKV